MANHKSAKKRSKQSQKKNILNRALLSKIKNSIIHFNNHLSAKQSDKLAGELHKSFSLINSSLAKAVKRGIIKKEYMSRKLSSLSVKLKKI